MHTINCMAKMYLYKMIKGSLRHHLPLLGLVSAEIGYNCPIVVHVRRPIRRNILIDTSWLYIQQGTFQWCGGLSERCKTMTVLGIAPYGSTWVFLFLCVRASWERINVCAGLSLHCEISNSTKWKILSRHSILKRRTG